MGKDDTVSDRRRHVTVVGALVAVLLGLGPVAVAAQQDTAQQAQPKKECKLQGTDVTQKAEKDIDDAKKAAAAGDSAKAQEAQLGFTSAMRLLKVALAQNGNDPAALWLLGRANVGLHDYVAADSALNAFIALEPGCQHLVTALRQQAWVDLYNQGVRSYQGGNTALAMAMFDSANIMSPDPRSLNNAALLHQQSGDTAVAESLYRKTLSTEGDSVQVQAATINLAVLLQRQGKVDDALQVYRDYLSKHPKAVTPSINLAVDLARAGQADSAKAILSSLAERQDLSFDDLTDLGTGLLQVQESTAAEKVFDRAHKANPYAKDGYMYLLQAAVSAGDFKTAADVGGQLLDHYPYEKDAYRAVAQSLDKLGRKQEVQQRLQQMQSLPLEFVDLQLQGQGGTYVVQGQVAGGTASGKKVTIPFTFYGPDGSKVTEKSISLTVPGQGEMGGVQFQVQSQQPIAGFTYGKATSGS